MRQPAMRRAALSLILAAVALAPCAAWAQGAKATAAPPTLTEGALAPLSQNLTGGLRIQLNLGGADFLPGQHTVANSLSVTLASDQAAIPVSGSFSATTSATASATPTSISAGAGAALNLNLNSALFTQPTYAGTPVDLTHGLPVNIVGGGGTGGTALADEAAFTAGTTSHTLAGGFFQTTATSNPLTNGQAGAAQMTATRALFSNLRNASGTEVGTAGAPFQVSIANTGANATAIKVDNSAVTQPISGAVTQGGTWTVQPGNTANTTPWKVDNSGQTQPSSIADGSDAALGAKADAAWSGSGSASVVALLKSLYVAPGQATKAASTPVVLPSDQTVPVSAVLGTTNGWTPLAANALSTTVKAIKSSAGQLGMLQCWNPNSTVVYIQLFNVASGSVTLGTTAPTLPIPIAPTSTGGFALSNPGINFSTAMSMAATTTATGLTAPGTAVDCNAAYN